MTIAEPAAAAQIRVLSALTDIPRTDWDACANPGWASDGTAPAGKTPPVAYNPFLAWDFLQALEESGSASRKTGWSPRHLVLEDPTGSPAAVMPCYAKSHSQGEYVFDWGWADAFERAGGNYYPKLQVSVPFTPATGRRLLVRPGVDENRTRSLLVAGLLELTRLHGASSAHLTFLPKEEWDLLGETGLLQRTDQQFHWVDDGYGTFDGFLAALASRKRKAVRKERRDALSAGIEIEWLTGQAITEKHWDAFFGFYMDTGSRKWGQPYLNRRFFSMLGQRMANRVLLIMAKRQGRYVAGALNLIGSETLYGRYWGCTEEHPLLHFEVCYYQAIDFALAHGLSRVEAGAQGEHKLARGYMPQITYSAHYIANPGLRDAVERYLVHERQQVAMTNAVLAEHGPFRHGDTTEPREPGEAE